MDFGIGNLMGGGGIFGGIGQMFSGMGGVFGIFMSWYAVWVPLFLALGVFIVIGLFRKNYKIWANVYAQRGNGIVRIWDWGKIIEIQDSSGMPIKIVHWMRHPIPCNLPKRDNLYIGQWGFFVSDFRETADGVRIPVSYVEDATSPTLKPSHAGMDMWNKSYNSLIRQRYSTAPPLKWYQNPTVMMGIGIVIIGFSFVLGIKLFGDSVGKYLAPIAENLGHLADAVKGGLR